MTTIKLKEAIGILAHGGFLQEPDFYWTKYCNLYDLKGELIGWVTYDCYFEISNTLGSVNSGGLLKMMKFRKDTEHHDCSNFKTIHGDYDILDKSLKKDKKSVDITV